MTRTELMDAIHDWVESVVTPQPVDWEDFDDADRRGDRVTLRFFDDSGRPFPRVELISDTRPDNEKVTEQVTLTLVINCWGRAAMDTVGRIRASLWSAERSAFHGLWGKCGLGVIRTINNLSALESATIAARYEMRITLHTVFDYSFGGDCADVFPTEVIERRLGTVYEADLPINRTEGCP